MFYQIFIVQDFEKMGLEEEKIKYNEKIFFNL